MAQQVHRVLIVGAGMAGLSAARHLSDSGVNVTLIDEHNYTTFPPMLFYVATAFLSPEDVVRPIRALLPRRGTVSFQLSKVHAIDFASHRVTLDDDRAIPFDYVILAPGVCQRSRPSLALHNTRSP
jgi:NADH dehydrogenase